MEFLTFQRFDKKEDVHSFSEILKQNGIESAIEDTGNSLDSNFGNSALAIEYILKIKKIDFKKAEEISSEISKEQVEDVDQDYFLFQFSDEELKDVILKRDEWGNDNYALAKKILTDRGISISQEEMEDLEKKRLIQLAEPEKSQIEWILAGYLFAFLVGGLFIGRHLKSFKKTLPNGEKVLNYSPADRIHGERIYTIGKIFLVIWSLIGIFKIVMIE